MRVEDCLFWGLAKSFSWEGIDDVNPFTLRMAKRGLTILEIVYSQKHFIENI